MSIKKKNNVYISAVRLFEKGEINKAIKKCDEGISENLRNSALLNFKGLLLYLKGDLQGAVATWKTNSDYNDDNTAKNYLHDSKKDKERLEFYIKGEKALKNIHIDEAIQYFEKCRESDFNCIKASVALGICYIKKGDYSVASVHITKALELDRNNKNALELSKQLKEYAGIKLEIGKKDNFIKPICIGLIIALIACSGVFIINKTKTINKNKIVVSDKKENKPQKENVVNKVNDEENKGETITNNALVSIEELEEAISKKDYYNINNLLNGYNKDGLTEKEKAIIYNAKELLSSDDGLKYFYEKALDKYRAEKYEEATEDFTTLCTYGESNYLYPHGLYFIAICNNKLGNVEKSIEYYKKYYDKFPDGTYIEDVIYSLAMLYKDEDLYEAKKYAGELRWEHPESIYNNENISNLLE